MVSNAVLLLSRLLKLPRAEEVCPQDFWGFLQSITPLVIYFLPIEMARYAVRDCRFAGSRFAGQPEDRWTVGRGILRPSVDTLQYTD